MKVFVEPLKQFTQEVEYIFHQLGHNRGISVEFVNQLENADVSCGSTENFDFQISTSFYDKIGEGKFNHEFHFSDSEFIHVSELKPDYITTAFYLINSLQEYGEKTDLDEIGRFKYQNSYQTKYKNITQNIVDQCFTKICNHPKLEKYKSRSHKTKFFLSHDIDSINGAWLQDSLYLLKKGNPIPIFSLVMNVLLQRPDWFNMDKIMQMEDEYALKSTFFWIVNKGRLNKREVNADYSIGSKTIQTTIQSIQNSGWQNGLHKSISTDDFKTEIKKTRFNPVANRNHYLKFTLPEHYNRLEESGLQLDASLGFAEAYGFRNNYGLPFHPYDVKNRKPYSFIEVPLTIMDGTLQRYMGIPINETADTIIRFIEENKTNSLLSILWHNTHFTEHKYGGYISEYRKLLEYISSNRFECINPNEIIKQYRWQK